MPSNTYVVAKCPAAEHFRHFVHFRPYLTVGYSNVYPEFIYRNLAKGFSVSQKPVFAAVLFTISKIYSSTSTRISDTKEESIKSFSAECSASNHINLHVHADFSLIHTLCRGCINHQPIICLLEW